MSEQKQKNNFCTQHVLSLYFSGESMNNLSSHCGLTDSRMRASDIDLPVLIRSHHLQLQWKFKLWVCLRCEGKKFLGIVNKLLKTKKKLFQKFVDITQHCFTSLRFVNFPANNLNFHWSWRWWHQIKAIVLNLFYFINKNFTSSQVKELSWDHLIFFRRIGAQHHDRNFVPSSVSQSLLSLVENFAEGWNFCLADLCPEKTKWSRL